MRKLLILFAVLTLVHGGAWCAYPGDNADSGGRAAKPSRGGPGKKITAVGTVEPEEAADVGAHVPGTIASFGTDPHGDGKSIDYGSSVEVGTVLAQIDNELYVVRVEQEWAGCARAEAELAQAKINLEQAQAQWQIAQEKHTIATVSSTDYNLANFIQKSTKASVVVA